MGRLHPTVVAGLLTEAEADAAKEAVESLRERDRSRLNAACSAVEGVGPDD